MPMGVSFVVDGDEADVRALLARKHTLPRDFDDVVGDVGLVEFDVSLEQR
jgi:hypothetical protein